MSNFDSKFKYDSLYFNNVINPLLILSNNLIFLLLVSLSFKPFEFREIPILFLIGFSSLIFIPKLELLFFNELSFFNISLFCSNIFFVLLDSSICLDAFS